MATSDDNDEKTKKAIVLGILSSKAKTGLTADEIFSEYLEREGKHLMSKPKEAREFLNSIVTIELRNGRYFNRSALSSHVTKLVEGERDNNAKFHPNSFNGAYRGRYSNHNQSSFPRGVLNRRKSVCYEQEYIEVPKQPAPAPAPGKIVRRRITLGAQFRPDTPPRSRSRSSSPKKSDTFGRRHITNNENRLHSPVLGAKRPRDGSPRSLVAKRSRRSRSPTYDRRQYRPRSRSLRRDPRRRSVSRSRSPVDPRRKRNSPAHERTTTDFKPRQMETVIRPVQENTPAVRPIQTVTPQDAIQRAAINERLNGVTAVAGPSISVLSFKFNLIGDGLLYHVVHELDANVTLNPYLISQDLLMKTAIESVNAIIMPRVNKKKCIILSIGTSDLRKGTSLSDMRKQFVTLFRICQNNGLKPLVTTISCMDTMELIAKAKIFNEFLQQNFTNVIDLFNAVNGANGGLANTLASLRKCSAKSSQIRASLSIGMHSRLVLRVEV